MWMLFQRTYCLARACLCIRQVHGVLSQEGFKGARRNWLQPWLENSRDLPADSPVVQDVAWAVEKACAWQRERTECLHRSLVCYHLLRVAGARPQFIMAVRANPFSSHAWVEIGATAVADGCMDELRPLYRAILTVPSIPKMAA